MTTTPTNKLRKPRSDKGVPKEISEAHKRKMQEGRERKKRQAEKDAEKLVRQTVKRLEATVEKATKEVDKAAAKMDAQGGSGKCSDKAFKEYIKADTVLLNATTALAAHRNRITQASEGVKSDA